MRNGRSQLPGVGDTQRLRDDLGEEQHGEREDYREQPQRAGIESVLVTRSGDRGADRVCCRIEDQDRRDRHIHVFLESRQQVSGPSSFLDQDFDLRPGE